MADQDYRSRGRTGCKDWHTIINMSSTSQASLPTLVPASSRTNSQRPGIAIGVHRSEPPSASVSRDLFNEMNARHEARFLRIEADLAIERAMTTQLRAAQSQPELPNPSKLRQAAMAQTMDLYGVLTQKGRDDCAFTVPVGTKFARVLKDFAQYTKQEGKILRLFYGGVRVDLVGMVGEYGWERGRKFEVLEMVTA